MENSCQRLFARYDGIKHVWDPNGWPFANADHLSTVDILAGHERWIGVNSALLGSNSCAPKVVFLRRRNELARIVSNLLGQQTNLWGHDPSVTHTEREAAQYRDQVGARDLQPLNEDVIAWYLERAASWEDRIMNAIPQERVMTVHYEDLLGPDVDIETRLARASAVGEWLGAPMRRAHEELRTILGPQSKFNNARLYARIPNFERIVSQFGPI